MKNPESLEKRKIRLDKLHESNIGRKQSEKTKNKIAKSLTGLMCGKNHPFYNKHHTEEVKEQIKEARSGEKSNFYGKPPSPKVIRGKYRFYQSPYQGKIRLRSTYELAYAQYLDINKFIEIKGYMSDYAQNKINKTLKMYNIDLDILYYKDLKKLNCFNL